MLSEVQFAVYDDSWVFGGIDLLYEFIVQVYGHIFVSLVFPLEIIMILGFCSLNLILFPVAQLDIFLLCNLAWFPASRTVSALTAISKSSAKAIAFVRLPYSRLSSELYWIFQNAGPQQEPWESLCSLLFLFVCCPCSKLLSFR